MAAAQAAPSDEAVAKKARQLIAPSLDKLVNAASGRKYQKLRQGANELSDALLRLLTAPPKPAAPAGRREPTPQLGVATTPLPTPALEAGDETVKLVLTEDGFKLSVVSSSPVANGVAVAAAAAADSPAADMPLSPGLTIATPAEVAAAESAEDSGQVGGIGNGNDFQVLSTPPGLNAEAAQAVLALLRQAVETRRPPIVEVALDCLQNLIAHKLLSGPVFTINHRREGATTPGGKAKRSNEEEEEAGDVDSESLPTQAQALELLCLCDDIADEVVERRVLKGLLTAVTSTHLFVHGQALLLAVRACYNIFLMSRDATNQVTAKATLTQMVNAVFFRMEAGDFVLVKPIVVTDVLGMPSADINSMSAAVQSFLHEVMSSVDITGSYVGGYMEGIQRGLDAAFTHEPASPREGAQHALPNYSTPGATPRAATAPGAGAG